MKFGLFAIAPWHESMTPEQVLTDTLEQIELGDRLGLDEVWLGEHRFSRHGLLSGFFSYCGHVAARTKNVRIGTAVIVLPLHNPVLVAEEIAMLDVLSGGRMEVGVGSGCFPPQDCPPTPGQEYGVATMYTIAPFSVP